MRLVREYLLACALLAIGAGTVAAAQRPFAPANAVQSPDAGREEADGTTALHRAAQAGDRDAVDRMIRAGADVRGANRYGITPLWLASLNGDAAIVKRLLQAGADPRAGRADSGETPLMIAARAGHVDVIRLLLSAGADSNAAETVRGQTALMWAAAQQHPAAVKVLLEAGADIRALSATRISALMFAIRAGDAESARLLLDAGLDVNAPAADGTSMLALAMINLRFRLATFLLDRGADPNADDPRGSSLHLLGFLRRANNRSLSDIIPRMAAEQEMDSLAFAEELVKRGTNVNARIKRLAPGGRTGVKNVAIGSYSVSFEGATPFFVAAITNDLAYMKFLAAKGADASMPNVQEITPLLAAAGVGFTLEGENPGTPTEALEAVKLAYELGNDPKAVVPVRKPGSPRRAVVGGTTALHAAADRGADELIKWLVERGVPLDAKNDNGRTAWELAAGSEDGQQGGGVWPNTADLLAELMAERGLNLPENAKSVHGIRRK